VAPSSSAQAGGLANRTALLELCHECLGFAVRKRIGPPAGAAIEVERPRSVDLVVELV
jgi:hypothetical protein